MKKSRQTTEPRNWFLVVFSSLLIILGVMLVILSIANAAEFGWWSLLVGFTGASLTFLAIMSIVKNDPAWILIGFVIPG